jgi:hypothetical protein
MQQKAVECVTHDGFETSSTYYVQKLNITKDMPALKCYVEKPTETASSLQP